MQVVRFGEKEVSNIIGFEDVVEDEKKIYCYTDGSCLWFLHHAGNEYVEKGDNKTYRYYWIDLHLRIRSSCGGVTGYKTFKEALNTIDKDYGSTSYKLIIFVSQCEVLEYAKKM